MIKRLIFFGLSLLVILGGGCSYHQNRNIPLLVDPHESKEERVEDKEIRVALVMKTLTNPFFIEMEKGARQAEKEYGIELVVRTGAQETSINQQIQIVEELIGEGVDAIVIAPGNSTELIPVLKKAQGAGISVVNIDNRLNTTESKKMGLKNVPFISIDNEKGAYLAVQYMVKSVKKPMKAAIIEGIVGTINSQQRKEGALRAFGENPNIDVVSIQTANWKIDEGYEAAQRIVNQYPDVGIIFCANDMMALGVIQYLEENKLEGIMVGGFDALEEAKQAIKDKSLQVTVDQSADRQGYIGVVYALELLKGQAVEPQVYVDITLIHKGNLN